MANKVKVDVVIDDKGKLKQVAESSKQAGKGLDNTAKNAKNAERNIKGVANSSSNSTKNFSKMAQGMGGVVVPAYAAFAAQMFALTAAFGFFKRAGDLAVLQAGQTAYASATGIAMKSLTKDIMSATGAQISFRDAAQAAAIGTSAGLNANQLKELGTAAKDVSAILGRDVTDSFNRLIRGVTKAEPELLDELGIILRLDKATTDYGLSIGKTKDELNAFERTQAVTNEVLNQAQDKYSRILEATGGGGVNAFNKLSVALDEVVMKIQKFLLPIANKLANVLTEVPLLAGAGFALMASGPLKAIGFDLKEMGSTAKESANEAKEAYKKLADQVKAASMNVADHRKNVQGLARDMAATQGPGGSKLVSRIAEAGVVTGTDRANIKSGLAAIEGETKRSTMVMKGMFKGMSVGAARDFGAAITSMNLATKSTVPITASATLQIQALWARTSAFIQMAAARISGAMAIALSWLGWLSLIATAFYMIADAMGFFEKKISEAEQSQLDYIENMKQMTEDTKDFIAVQKILTEGGSLSSGIAGMGALGNLTGGMSPTDSVQMIEDLISGTKEYNKVLDENTAIANRNDEVRKKNMTRPFKQIQEEEIDVQDRLTESQVESFKMLQKMRTGYRDIADATGVTSTATEAYLVALDTANKFSKEELLQMKKLSEAELLMIGNQKKMTAAATKANDEFEQSFHPLSQYQKQIKAINAAIENQILVLKAQKVQTSEASEQMRIDIKRLEKQRDLIREVDQARHLSERAAMGFKLEEIKLDKNLTANARKQALQEIERKKINQEITEAKQRQQQILKGVPPLIKRYTDSETQAMEVDNDRIASAQARLKKLGVEITLTQALADTQDALSNARKKHTVELASLEQSLLEVDKRSLSQQKESLSLLEKEQALKLKEMGRSRKRSGGLFSKFGDEKAAAAEALKAAEAQLVQKTNFIIDEHALKQKTIAAEYKLLEAKRNIAQLEAAAKGAELLADGDSSTDAAGDAYNDLAKQLGLQKGVLEEQQKMAETLATRGRNLTLSELTSSLDDLRDTNDDLQDMQSLVDGIEDSVANNMTSAFVGLVDGTKSFKQAFSQMAVAILQDITQMIIRMMVMRALMAVFQPVPTVGQGLPGDTVAMGPQSGIAPQSQLARLMPGELNMRYGGMPKYATGGIARGSQAGYPAVLHGTEAVIPMPHGSIPVEFQGAGGGGTQVNNITVNISSDGSSSTQQSGGGQNMEQLGSLVASAVQDELTNQKRAGGILSPYGSA